MNDDLKNMIGQIIKEELFNFKDRAISQSDNVVQPTFDNKRLYHERAKLELLYGLIGEALLQTKITLATDQWATQTKNQKGNFILHKLMDVLEQQGYL